MSIKETLKKVADLAEYYKIDKPYLVGGLPRDIYIQGNIKTKDVDITTNSSDVLRLGILTANFFNTPFEISDDGHITVFMENLDLDFSSNFISENVKEYLTGDFKNFEEAFSRDFTINILHQDLENGNFFDPTGQSVEDLKNKIIRTPVPAEITLTDDPRRAYRAINLAVRYGFKIDEDIINFVKNNNDLFSGKKTGAQGIPIKDKYITVKINNSLSYNPDLTIKYLKDMNLFRNVPLTGDFKNILIEKKLLNEYLNLNNIKKAAVMNSIAKNWEEYSSQGPAHQEVMEWWKDNYSKIPEHKTSDYQSWTKWYMNHYNTDWAFVHKSPEETLEIMKAESESKLKPLLSERGDLPGKGFFEKLKFKKDKEPGKKLKTPFSRSDYLRKVDRNPHANLSDITDDLKSFISVLGETAEELGVQKPRINSGKRTVEQQANAMWTNWNNNGGMKGGREYLINLYNDTYANNIADAFERNYNRKSKAIQEASVIVAAQPTPRFGHTSEIAAAIDLHPTQGIEKVFDTIKNTGRFDFKILDERRAANHWHLEVMKDHGLTQKVASIQERKYILKQLSLLYKNIEK